MTTEITYGTDRSGLNFEMVLCNSDVANVQSIPENVQEFLGVRNSGPSTELLPLQRSPLSRVLLYSHLR